MRGTRKKETNVYERCRKKYKPDEVKFLIIAESPPPSGDRFFYFPKVEKKDYLYIALMRAIFGEHLSVGDLRSNKESFLRRFQRKGFFLIDAVDYPLPDSRSEKRKAIKENLPRLIEKVEKLVKNRRNIKVIIISCRVYDICYEKLKEKFPVVDERIPFPSSGHQRRFHEKFKRALKKKRRKR